MHGYKQGKNKKSCFYFAFRLLPSIIIITNDEMRFICVFVSHVHTFPKVPTCGAENEENISDLIQQLKLLYVRRSKNLKYRTVVIRFKVLFDKHFFSFQIYFIFIYTYLESYERVSYLMYIHTGK